MPSLPYRQLNFIQFKSPVYFTEGSFCLFFFFFKQFKLLSQNMRFYFEVWIMSCETDPEYVIKDDCIVFVYCVLLPPATCSFTSSHSFQNKSLCFCCCMIVSEGNIFCFCPLWANKSREGRLSHAGLVHCCSREIMDGSFWTKTFRQFFGQLVWNPFEYE